MDKQSTGDKIREYRKLAGLTQQELAKKSGISMMSIRRYETGERQPDAETISKIAKALAADIFAFIPDDQRRMVEEVAYAYSQGHNLENRERILDEWAKSFFEFEDADDRKNLAIESMLMQLSSERTVSYLKFFEGFTEKDLIANCVRKLSFLTKEGIVEVLIRIDELMHVPQFNALKQFASHKDTDQMNKNEK